MIIQRYNSVESIRKTRQDCTKLHGIFERQQDMPTNFLIPVDRKSFLVYNIIW